MREISNTVKLKLQMGLNKRLFDAGRISYDMYSRANEVLVTRLTQCSKSDIIIHSEKINYESGDEYGFTHIEG